MLACKFRRFKIEVVLYANIQFVQTHFLCSRKDNEEIKKLMIMHKEIGRLDFGLAKIGLPLLYVTKGDHGLFFLVDSGASHNIIRKDVLEFFNEPAEKESINECVFLGIDGIEHKTTLSSFSFTLNSIEHEENFQVLEDGNALDFQLDKETVLSVHGIVGVDFLIKYKFVIDFSTFTLRQFA